MAQVQAIGNMTGFRGVSQSRKTGRYRATLNFEGKRTRSGWVLTAVAAAKIYDRMAITAHGDEAWLNFPLAGFRQALAVPTTEAPTCRDGHPFPANLARRRRKGKGWWEAECLACIEEKNLEGLRRKITAVEALYARRRAAREGKGG